MGTVSPLRTKEEFTYPGVVHAPRHSCALGGAYMTALATFGTLPILYSGTGCGMAQNFAIDPRTTKFRMLETFKHEHGRSFANDKSIAWGIAQAFAREGANLGFSYAGEALAKRVYVDVALRDVGTEAVMVRYPREGHGIQEPNHQIDLVGRQLEWFDSHLGIKREKSGDEKPMPASELKK